MLDLPMNCTGQFREDLQIKLKVLRNIRLLHSYHTLICLYHFLKHYFVHVANNYFKDITILQQNVDITTLSE